MTAIPTRERGKRSATDIDVFVGERVRELRHEQGLTLNELAQTLSISHQQLQKYETGANRLSAGMLYDVATVLGVTTGDLFPGGDLSRIATGQKALRTLEAIRKLVNQEPA